MGTVTSPPSMERKSTSCSRRNPTADTRVVNWNEVVSSLEVLAATCHGRQRPGYFGPFWGVLRLWSVRADDVSMSIQPVASQPAAAPAGTPQTLAASQQEAAREAQQGIQDGDEPLTGSKVNASA